MEKVRAVKTATASTPSEMRVNHLSRAASMASSSSTPPFDPSGTRYDQKTYAGRLAHFREMVSPSTLFVSDALPRRNRAGVLGFPADWNESKRWLRCERRSLQVQRWLSWSCR